MGILSSPRKRLFLLYLFISISYFGNISITAFTDEDVQNDNGEASGYTYNITYNLSIKTLDSGIFKLFWVSPKNTSYQRVYSLEYNENVLEQVLDEHDNIFAVFEFAMNQSDEFILSMIFTVNSLHNVNLAKNYVIKEYDVNSEIYTRFTSSQEKIEVNDKKIIEKANELRARAFPFFIWILTIFSLY
jgi:hypothetical protein